MKTIDIFPWDEHFSTGIDEIDKQHRVLVDILNRLASNIAYSTNEKSLNAIFDELTEYTIYHFQTEEAIWHKYLPDDALESTHQIVHQNFIDTVLKLKSDQATRPLSQVAEEALEFLTRWLASHILETDRYMAHIVLALEEGLDINAAKVHADERMSGSTRLLIDIILSIYGTLTSNTLHLMRELKTHQQFEIEINHQKDYQSLLLELSSEFINLPLDKIDLHIKKALKKMATFVGADRAYIFDYNFQNKTITNTYKWSASGVTPQIQEMQSIPLSSIPGLPQAHKKGDYVFIQDVPALKKGPLRDLLLSQQIQSLVTFPIFKNTTCEGFVGFDTIKNKRKFSQKEITLLELFSKILSHIAEKKHNELELLHERSHLQTLFKAIPDLVWIKDINGVYLSCNPRFENFFGATEEEIIGKTDYDFLEKSLAESFRIHDQKVIQSGNININEEKVSFASDGHEEILHTTKVPIYDDFGNINGVMGVSRNITEMKNIQKELEKKEHYQRALLDNFPFMVWLKDEQSRFLALNQPMANICGFSSTEDLIGKTDYDIWPKDLADAYHQDDMQILTSQKSKMIEEPIETFKGRIWSETYKSPVSVDGKVIGTVGFSRDITDRKELERNLLEERDRFKHYLNTVEAIIISLDAKGYITLVNRKCCEVLGYTKKELIGQLWFELCLSQPEGMQEMYPLFLEIMTGDSKGIEYFENAIVSKSKEEHIIAWHNSYLYDSQNNIIGTLSSGEDITRLKEQQERLEHMAHYDTLTDLPNRILLSDRLHQAIIQTKRHKLTLAVIYLDLDGFKEINDTYGHDNGDILLKVLSSRIKQILRDGDTIARLGGDEFVIVLYDLKDQQDCLPMLTRILNTVSQPTKTKEILMQVSGSLGVTFYSHDDILDADQLLRQADQAMYQAKLAGKNRFHIFDVKQNEHIRNHHESLEAIENAIKNNEFVMHYQPKVNMRSGEVLGVESLIRWEHPTYGLLYPGTFLPTIENHQLSVRLGSWVIDNVMKQIQKWKKEKRNITVSINISPLQLQDSDFISNLLHLLKKYPQVHPNDFEFEILESSALEDMNHVSYIMQECNKIGVAFLLDDFGTGYSSLTYLKNLPAKQLKIDQSFVRDMLDDTDDMAILEGIISLANAFRREVIAEGVESLEQGKMLLRLGCEEAQGYVIAKPMPATKLINWIEHWSPPWEWKNITTISRDDTPLLYAITEHNIWMNGVISYLQGNRVMFPEMNHKKCHFGAWIYKQGTEHYEKKDGFKEIEALHHKIHNKINIILKKHDANSLEDYNAAIEIINDYRTQFIKLFTSSLLDSK